MHFFEFSFIVTAVSICNAQTPGQGGNGGNGGSFGGPFPVPASQESMPSPVKLYNKCHVNMSQQQQGPDTAMFKAQACVQLYISVGILQETLPGPNPNLRQMPGAVNPTGPDSLKQICPSFRRVASNLIRGNYEDVCCDIVCMCQEVEQSTVGTNMQVCGGAIPMQMMFAPPPQPTPGMMQGQGMNGVNGQPGSSFMGQNQAAGIPVGASNGFNPGQVPQQSQMTLQPQMAPAGASGLHRMSFKNSGW